MIPKPLFPAGRQWLMAGVMGYGLLIWLLLPAGVVAINDDFGYLKSVVQTIQHHRPWTDDWLEPWAASLSSMAAVLYAGTVSFSFAVHGLLAALASASVAGSYLLLVQRGVKRTLALALGAVVLSFPTLLWKSVEFTSVALYLPCLIWALWAGERKRWGLFFLVWLLAVAARQSAITWLLIPLWSAARGFFTSSSDRTSRSWLVPAGVVGAGAAVFWGLSHGMNQTHAQAVLTAHSFAHIVPRDSARVLGVGLLVYLCAVGGGVSLMGGLRRGGPGENFRSPARIVLFAVIFLGLLAIDEREWIQMEHTLLSGSSGWLYTKSVVGVAIAGWAWGRFRLRADYAFFALGSLGLLSVRGVVWDYYLLDVAVLGFFGISVKNEQERTLPTWAGPRWPVALLAAFHLLFFLDLKCALDRGRALCVLAETALRDRSLRVEELSFAPFGFTAWHLYPHYIEHEGKTSGDLAGFGRYLRTGAVEVGQGYSRPLHVLPRFRHEPPADRHNLVASGRFRYAWFFEAEFFLLRFKTEAEQSAEIPLPADYERPPFPLDDSEWSALIEARSVR
jgi:hypothetical protein